MHLSLLAIALLSVGASARGVPQGLEVSHQQRYDGEQVLRCVPKSEAQLTSLRSIWKYLPHLDWWSEPRAVGVPVYIHLTYGRMTSLINLLGLSCSVMISDLQVEVERERADIEARRELQAAAGQDDFDYENYHELEEIEAWMDSIVTQYPKLANKFLLGKSFEGRQIHALKISTSSDKKPAVWFEGGIHAREWITSATVIYMTKMLLNSSGNAVVETMLKELDWYILPVFNVDGYEYSWKTSRTWRKTRSRHNGTTCVGVDPNRNWPFHWGEDGAGTEPCADNYRGPKPLSEIEVASVTDFLNQSSIDFRGFIDFHSFGQLWMYPWGYTKQPCPDAKTLNEVSKLAVDALAKVHGTNYKYGNIADIIYVASGSSADWTYATAKIPLSFGVELRDTGEHGFVLPAKQIRPSGEETFAAVQQWATWIIQHE